ncbi:hypothetical protein H696_05239 [Fonticula alba]|uniref:DNA-directed primase/polymerase protein n=1 Tax=Fonticula alba TaxID=691883 RepID=A0A058Z468_FONAL|nr:hypothetical protein H696_05239 [Fonticula alba]KCV68322.1 hypothetical protein H696_05239 [Fonticula alba]|eukprot:XP_009497376.1 hypothetical protein H696_05239 [Fonticula alba]
MTSGDTPGNRKATALSEGSFYGTHPSTVPGNPGPGGTGDPLQIGDPIRKAHHARLLSSVERSQRSWFMLQSFRLQEAVAFYEDHCSYHHHEAGTRHTILRQPVGSRPVRTPDDPAGGRPHAAGVRVEDHPAGAPCRSPLLLLMAEEPGFPAGADASPSRGKRGRMDDSPSRRSATKRVYYVACASAFWLGGLLARADLSRHFYEWIPSDGFCRLYFDIEFSQSKNPHIDGPAAVRRLKAYIVWMLNRLYGPVAHESMFVHLESRVRTCPDCASSLDRPPDPQVDLCPGCQVAREQNDKFSCHLLLDVPGTAWRDCSLAQGCGGFVRWLLAGLKDALDVYHAVEGLQDVSQPTDGEPPAGRGMAADMAADMATECGLPSTTPDPGGQHAYEVLRRQIARVGGASAGRGIPFSADLRDALLWAPLARDLTVRERDPLPGLGCDMTGHTFLIDMAVYRRNGIFRTYLSSKLQKPAVLLSAEAPAGARPDWHLFRRSLVSLVSVPTPEGGMAFRSGLALAQEARACAPSLGQAQPTCPRCQWRTVVPLPDGRKVDILKAPGEASLRDCGQLCLEHAAADHWPLTLPSGSLNTRPVIPTPESMAALSANVLLDVEFAGDEHADGASLSRQEALVRTFTVYLDPQRREFRDFFRINSMCLPGNRPPHGTGQGGETAAPEAFVEQLRELGFHHFIESLCARHARATGSAGDAGFRLRSIQVYPSRIGLFRINITPMPPCLQRGRCHQSNAVYYLADFTAGRVSQRCYDQDCIAEVQAGQGTGDAALRGWARGWRGSESIPDEVVPPSVELAYLPGDRALGENTHPTH